MIRDFAKTYREEKQTKLLENKSSSVNTFTIYSRLCEALGLIITVNSLTDVNSLTHFTKKYILEMSPTFAVSTKAQRSVTTKYDPVLMLKLPWMFSITYTVRHNATLNCATSLHPAIATAIFKTRMCIATRVWVIREVGQPKSPQREIRTKGLCPKAYRFTYT